MQTKNTIVALATGLLLAAPAAMAGGGLDVRVGAFLPEAKGNIFADTQELFGTKKGDWQGVSGGVDFNLGLGSNVELGFGIDAYSRALDTFYVDFERPSGDDINQTLKLTVVPLSVSLKLVANNRRGALSPYLMVGADAYFWEYEEDGDFIDFHSPDLEIGSDFFKSSGVAPGFHVGAGLRVPVGDDIKITGEARYHFAREVGMDDDFSRNRIDVSGLAVTVGVNVRF